MNVTIDARRWFRKTYGNTYHSVRVYTDNKLVGECLYTYGYGEQYLQTAHKLLQKAGIMPVTGERFKSGMDADYYYFRQDISDNRGKYHITCVDVSRKKDL